ncbi:LOW QUALITY PROTEIN: conserved hypothetical protein, partial [Mycobacterium tuberculosis T92]
GARPHRAVSYRGGRQIIFSRREVRGGFRGGRPQRCRGLERDRQGSRPGADDRRGVREAERAQLLPWTATLKRHCVRVIPWEITGRHFRFGPEPDRSQTFACEASSHNQR